MRSSFATYRELSQVQFHFRTSRLTWGKLLELADAGLDYAALLSRLIAEDSDTENQDKYERIGFVKSLGTFINEIRRKRKKKAGYDANIPWKCSSAPKKASRAARGKRSENILPAITKMFS